MTSPAFKRIGIMGGMFDPVHRGHVQLARAVQQLAALDEIRLVPCGTPVHRPSARASAEHRLAMLALAIAGEPGMQVDPRECRSPARSYTHATLAAIRAEQPGSVLFLVMGVDAFLQFHTWHRWQELFALAHLVVASRPGYQLQSAQLDTALLAAASPRFCAQPEACTGTAGHILLAELDTPAISSTMVRSALREQDAGAALLAPAVYDYIRQHRLYLTGENH